jgi:tripartite-type tricarboxylate transporter receptor subunit TctC
MARLSVALLGASTLITAGSATSAGAIDFAGQRIEMIVPFQEGGGADTWARFVARFLPDKLPGKPTVVVRNVPGGGAVIGANYFQQHAKPDGMMMLAVSSSVYFSYVLSPDNPRIKFDPKNYIGILGSPLGSLVYARSSTGLKTAADLTKKPAEPLVIPVQSATGGDIRTLLTLDMLNLKYEPVFGVTGNDANMGILRGEYNIQRDNSAAYLATTASLAKSGEVNPLFSFGFQDGKGIGRDPAFPDLPNFIEAYKIVHGKDPSGPQFEAWKTFFSGGVTTAKGLILPGGTPADILAAYDGAIKALVEDPEFQAAAKAELGGYPQVIGPEARAAITQAWTMTPETRAWIINWLKTRFNATL